LPLGGDEGRKDIKYSETITSMGREFKRCFSEERRWAVTTWKEEGGGEDIYGDVFMRIVRRTPREPELDEGKGL